MLMHRSHDIALPAHASVMCVHAHSQSILSRANNSALLRNGAASETRAPEPFLWRLNCIPLSAHLSSTTTGANVPPA
eukprot:6199636-Pleurochrysis_carterae.AAC.1